MESINRPSSVQHYVKAVDPVYVSVLVLEKDMNDEIVGKRMERISWNRLRQAAKQKNPDLREEYSKILTIANNLLYRDHPDGIHES